MMMPATLPELVCKCPVAKQLSVCLQEVQLMNLAKKNSASNS